MSRIRTLCAVFLALPLIAFGGDYFLQIMDPPEFAPSSGQQLLQSMRDGGLMAPIALSHVAAGLLLLLPRGRFLGALLQLPISLGIVAFHFTMMPEGLAFGVVLLILNLIVLLDPRRGRAVLAAPT